MNPIMLFEMLHIIKPFIAVREITHKLFTTSAVVSLNMCVEIGFPSEDSINSLINRVENGYFKRGDKILCMSSE